MPELPEVETTARGLKKKVLNKIFIDAWADAPKLVKKPTSFIDSRERIKGKRIKKISRKGKNIVFELSESHFLLVHQKMTGHLLYGKWEMKQGKWVSTIKGPLKEDPMNRFLRLIFFLDNGFQMALSDLRKFAKVELHQLELKMDLGPDALKADLKKVFKGRKGRIKSVLMNQKVLAGIGNIYSDEILFFAKVHPLKPVNKLKPAEIKRIEKAMKRVLKKAIALKGTSISDYRTVLGGKGSFAEQRKVYRKKGEKCPRCSNRIKRIKVGSRSAHFCPKCQKL